MISKEQRTLLALLKMNDNFVTRYNRQYYLNQIINNHYGTVVVSLKGNSRIER